MNAEFGLRNSEFEKRKMDFVVRCATIRIIGFIIER
jgi:hypothetical protein